MRSILDETSAYIYIPTSDSLYIYAIMIINPLAYITFCRVTMRDRRCVLILRLICETVLRAASAARDQSSRFTYMPNSIISFFLFLFIIFDAFAPLITIFIALCAPYLTLSLALCVCVINDPRERGLITIPDRVNETDAALWAPRDNKQLRANTV